MSSKDTSRWTYRSSRDKWNGISQQFVGYPKPLAKSSKEHGMLKDTNGENNTIAWRLEFASVPKQNAENCSLPKQATK